MSRLTTLRNQVASLKQVAYREAPIPAALAGWSFVGLERLGKKATETRERRLSLLSAGLMMMLVGPAAAQVGCGNGALGFLTDLHSLVQQSAGLILGAMVIAAGVMKMVPTRGTNAIGNALIGGVLVGVVFLVVGPALVDIAARSSPVNMNAQCGGGGGG